jgi:hypothetical protein
VYFLCIAMQMEFPCKALIKLGVPDGI